LFFFSSRRRHTRFSRDWSSDVCSSDLHRRYLINNYLDTIRGTVFRQVKFAEFEKLTHERVEGGGALTADWMSERYYELVKQYYGPDMVADDEIAIEWARIPHFYRALDRKST